MDKLPFSVASNLLCISSSVDELHFSISNCDRVSIVRECTDIISLASEIIQSLVPKDSSINILNK